MLAAMMSPVGGSPVRAGGAGLLYEVDSLADIVASDAQCTLREAITSSNGTATDCGPGSSGADGIGFGVDGTIVLAGPLPPIVGDVVIDGSGRSVAVSGPFAPGVAFQVLAASTVDFKRLTVANAYQGLLNTGTVHMTEVAFAGSAVGAVENFGTMTILQGTFTNNGGDASEFGGAVYNTGTLTVTASTFKSNHADHAFGRGGAIYNSGGVTVNKSMLSRNSAGMSGGAIYSRAPSGIVIGNSTFSGNAAPSGGAIQMDATTLTLSNSTVARNTGTTSSAMGIDGAIATLHNTVVLGGSGVTCQTTNDGILSDGGGNISWPDSTCPGLHADPRLDRLLDNGGRTKTIALGWGSPAIDRGDPTTCAVAPINNRDQRGGTRPVDGDANGIARCDSGAFEYGALKPPAPVLVSNTNVSGGEALTWARARDALRYVVEVRTGSSLVATRTTTGTTVTIALGGGMFTWTVQACNELGCTRSASRSFTR